MDDPTQLMVPPGSGRAVSLGGIGVVFKIAGSQTAGAFSIVEHPVQPGVLVPPHLHSREDEYSFVIEGEVGARVGDREVSGGPGTYILKPRGVPHTFWNAGTTLARLVEIISPAGFDRYFEDMAALVPAQGMPDFEKVADLGSRYGLSFVEDAWVPELCARYGLSVLGR
ncbi:MAG: cupin domain-containing protein [Acidimicrobiia bacterium]